MINNAASDCKVSMMNIRIFRIYGLPTNYLRLYYIVSRGNSSTLRFSVIVSVDFKTICIFKSNKIHITTLLAGISPFYC